MNTLDVAKLTDRELLILLHERQGVMGDDVKVLKEGTSEKLALMALETAALKETKADKTVVERLERSQQRLFNYLWFAFGALAVLQIVIPLVIKSLTHS